MEEQRGKKTIGSLEFFFPQRLSDLVQEGASFLYYDHHTESMVAVERPRRMALGTVATARNGYLSMGLCAPRQW